MTITNGQHALKAEIVAKLTNRLNQSVMSFHNGIVILISGPNGVGKGTICTQLLEDNKHPVFRVIRHTSRFQGIDDSNGITYHFVSQEEFEVLIKMSEFLEWSKYDLGYYGSTISAFLHEFLKGRNVMLDLDVDAALMLKQIFAEVGIHCITLMITPIIPILLDTPAGLELALDSLQKNMLNRKRGESQSELQGRLKTAKKWLSNWREFTYCIVNEDGFVEKAVGEIRDIIADENIKHQRSNQRVSYFK